MASEWKPRLCVMEKGENGYGFHLHGEKGKSGQFIRKVEPGSPAEASGLRAGDRVVAVNGVNVEKETHHQVSRYIFTLLALTCVAGCRGVSTGRSLLAGVCILTRCDMGQSGQPARKLPTLPSSWRNSLQVITVNTAVTHNHMLLFLTARVCHICTF